MNEVIDLRVLDKYRIWLKFNDKEEKIVDLQPYIGKGFTAELLDYDAFRKVFIEPGGGIAWTNGYDMCPNFLKELVEANESQDITQNA